MFFLLGERIANPIINVCYGLIACVWRFIWLSNKGPKKLLEIFSLREFKDKDRHIFFGYYDISPITGDDTLLLAMRAPVNNNFTDKNKTLQVGFFNLNDKNHKFNHIGETTTWCWQQGCRFQWYPINEKGKNLIVLYNQMVDGQYGCIIQDIKSKHILHSYKFPIYSVDSDGKIGLSLNFSRLHRLRPGYGYSNLPDNTINQLAPMNDGIWRINMQTGKGELLFSVAEISMLAPLDSMQGAEHYFNHILFNPSGSRFMFLHVWIRYGKRFIRLITADADGTRKFALVNEGHISHYTWKNDEELLCYSTHKDTGQQYHLYKDLTNEKKVIGKEILNRDGHPSYSPDGQLLLTDVKNHLFSEQKLLLFYLVEQKLKAIGPFSIPLKYKGELRCDLHPRWSPSGRYISFDSAHTGIRAIYVIDFEMTRRRFFD